MKSLYKLPFVCIALLLFSCNKRTPVNPSPANSKTSFHIKMSNPDSTYLIRTIVQLKDESYLLAGELLEIKTQKPENLILKFNSEGKLLWKHTLPGAKYTIGILGLVINDDGTFDGYLPVGENNDPEILNFDINGNVIGHQLLPGGVFGYRVVGSNKAMTISGTLHNTLAFEHIENGVVKWLKTFESGARANDVSEGPDGSFIAVGLGTPTLGNYLKKLDRNGDLIWEKPYSGDAVAVIANGEFLTFQVTEAGIDFSMFDSNGNQKWTINQKVIATATVSLQVLNLDNRNFAFNLVKNDGKLYFHLFDNLGNMVKTVTVDNFTADQNIKIATTSDNGVIIEHNSSQTTWELIKLPNLLQ